MQSNHFEMHRLSSGQPTKSAKIRTLAAAGFARADIARFLGIRYQHVRKVLIDDEARRGKEVRAGSPSSAPSHSSELGPTKVRLGPDGRIVVPAAFREALGIREGDPLFASIKDGELHLLTVRAAVRKAQTLVRQFVPEGVSLVDEILDDRRLEFDQEQTNG